MTAFYGLHAVLPQVVGMQAAKTLPEAGRLRQHFLLTVCRCWNFCETRKPRDAVFEMNDEIILVELAEIDLSAVTLGVIKPASRVRRKTSEQFRRRQNDEICRGKTKAARERAEDKIDILQRLGADQFTETLDLSLSLKINNDARFVVLPFA